MNRQKQGKPAPVATCPSDGESLIMTFERPGAEFVCVVCGRWYGFLAPVPAEPSPELEARRIVLREAFDAGARSGVPAG